VCGKKQRFCERVEIYGATQWSVNLPGAGRMEMVSSCCIALCVNIFNAYTMKNDVVCIKKSQFNNDFRVCMLRCGMARRGRSPDPGKSCLGKISQDQGSVPGAKTFAFCANLRYRGRVCHCVG
jgi:hypothetical protein